MKNYINRNILKNGIYNENIPINNKMTSLFTCVIILFLSGKGQGQSLTNTVHKTQAAAEKVNDLWCYACHTMDTGELCVELTINQSSLIRKCKAEEFVCMVKMYSYTIGTENTTIGPKMWSLERRCAVNCESGCIVIGERTKLYACTSCCENSLCNTGRGSAIRVVSSLKIYMAIVGITYLSSVLFGKRGSSFIVSKIFIT